MNYKNLSKILVFISIAWLIISAISYFFKFISYPKLELSANTIELTVGFVIAVLLFAYSYKTKELLSLGIGLAVLSWTLGQLFWFSYEIIKGNTLPYPSVGEFGFLGAYFFLLGSMGKFKNKKKSILFLLGMILIMLMPVFFLFNSSNTLGALIYNFIFIAVITFVFYKALSKYTVDYKYLFIGILLFCLTDIIFIIEANIKNYTFICDMVYPLCFSILAYGALKEGELNG